MVTGHLLAHRDVALVVRCFVTSAHVQSVVRVWEPNTFTRRQNTSKLITAYNILVKLFLLMATQGASFFSVKYL